MSRSRVPVEAKVDARASVRDAVTDLEAAQAKNRNVEFGRRIAEILIDVRELERRITATIPQNQDPDILDPNQEVLDV